MAVAIWTSACGEGGTEPTAAEPSRPATVAVAPDNLTFTTLGDTLRLAAEVRDQTGRVMSGGRVTWLTRNPTIAEVNPAGLVTAVGSGTTMVVALTRLWELRGSRMEATGETSDSVAIRVDAPSFTLSGTVTDSRRPSLVLPGIHVRLEGWKRTTTTTDADGRYSFPNVGGTLKVTAHAEFSYDSQTVDVDMDADLTRDFAMEHDGVTPFRSTPWNWPSIIEPDSTLLRSVTYTGRGIRSLPDRRLRKQIRVNAFLFDAHIAEQIVEFRINPEFGDVGRAKTEVDKFAPALGRLPAAFLSKLDGVVIHRGEWAPSASGGSIVIHMNNLSTWNATRMGLLEEVFLHEAAHVSLDPDHARADGWRAAQAADGVFISDYARNNPVREDIAESAIMYFAVRYRPESLSRDERWIILTSMPNRLAYFEEQGLDMSPYEATGSLIPGLEPGSVASSIHRTVLPAPEATAVAGEGSVSQGEERSCERELEDPAQPWTAWEYPQELLDGACPLPGVAENCASPGRTASRSVATRCVLRVSGGVTATPGVAGTP